MKIDLCIRRGLRIMAAVIVAGVFVSAAFMPGTSVVASNPTAGGVTATVGSTVTWTGTAPGAPPAGNGESTCTTGDATATNCDVFVLNVAPGAWTGKEVRVKLTWTNVTTDY